MENASFVGLYGVIYPDSFPPGPDFSGVCYVWQTPSAQLMVLPLNSQHIPTGQCLFMSTREFGEHMQPIDAHATPGLCPSASIIRPDSPDLLGIWYEQALSGPKAANGEPCTPEQPLPHAKGLTDELPLAPVSRDEALFTPLWHPDELLMAVEEAQSAPPPQSRDPFALYAANSGPVLANHQTDMAVSNRPMPQAQSDMAFLSLDGTAPQHVTTRQQMTQQATQQGMQQILQPIAQLAAQPGVTAIPQAATQAVPQADRQEFLKAGEEKAEIAERNAKLEQVMRVKFAVLIDQMDETDNPALEGEMEKLLVLGSSFTWKQKFLFTEFGLALRRKRKYTLALACHLRALGLAGQDEHVLFNVARSEYELGNIEKAGQYLDQALVVAPDFDLARNFKLFLAGHGQA